MSSRIINGVRGINRVTDDVSSKPPTTIEWEQAENQIEEQGNMTSESKINTGIYLIQSGWAFIGLLIISTIIFGIGWRIGDRDRQKAEEKSSYLDSMFIHSTFGFFAFLLAFQLSASVQVFNNVRLVTLEESFAVSSLIENIDMLPSSNQLILTNSLKEYLDYRSNIFAKPFDFDVLRDRSEYQKILGKKIFRDVNDWYQQSNNGQKASISEVLGRVRAMNAAFDKVYLSFYTHSPAIFWQALVILLFIAVGIAGYKTGYEGGKYWVFTIIFLLVILGAIILCVSLGNPRTGVLNFDMTDTLLQAARRRLN